VDRYFNLRIHIGKKAVPSSEVHLRTALCLLTHLLCFSLSSRLGFAQDYYLAYALALRPDIHIASALA